MIDGELRLRATPDFEGQALIASAHWTFTTRRVDRSDVAGLSNDLGDAGPGDLVLCQITAIGQHRRLQLASKRFKKSYVGDLFVACVGDRYAPDQFEGRAALTVDRGDLLAGGGVVGLVETAHQRMSPPTTVRPLGLLTDQAGKVLNVDRYRLPTRHAPHDVTVIGVFGASMNAGKTTAAVSLAHGLSRAGHAVAGVKVTGTGSFGDFLEFEDIGVTTLDFTDVGLASTYRVPMARLEKGFASLVGAAAERGAQVIVAEFADGLFQREVAAILSGSRIKDRLDGVLFAAPDALGSVGGIRVLQSHGIRPFAVSGMVTCSPLAVQEAATVHDVPHLTREQLAAPDDIAPRVQPFLRKPRQPRRIAA